MLCVTLIRDLAPTAQWPLWSALRSVTGPAAPVFTILFVLEVCRPTPLARRLRIPMLAWPALNALVALRALLAGKLVWPVGPRGGSGDALLDAVSGVGSMLMTAVALALLLAHVARRAGGERRETAWFLLAALLVGAVGPVLDA